MPSFSIHNQSTTRPQNPSVRFVSSGRRYEFEDVPTEAFAAFRTAFAKARFSRHATQASRHRLIANPGNGILHVISPSPR